MLARVLQRRAVSLRPLATRTAVARAAARALSSATAVAATKVYRPRRALLYMPGSNPKMLAKAATVGADSVCMDLEDAVAPNAKAAARANIVSALNTLTFPAATEALVRINPVGSGLERDDVDAVLSAKRLPDGLVLPKVESAAHVQWLASRFPATHPVTGQPLAFILLIESAKALVNLREIVTAAPGRTAALIFGADDYAADVGAVRTAGGQEVWYGRNRMLVFAKAHGLQAIDAVQIRFQTTEDRDVLSRESRAAFELGYTGKQIIHPNQIAPVHSAFSPDPKAIAAAKRIVDAAAEHAAKGTGAFALDGKMIDAPTVLAAQRLLAMGQACGIAV